MYIHLAGCRRANARHFASISRHFQPYAQSRMLDSDNDQIEWSQESERLKRPHGAVCFIPNLCGTHLHAMHLQKTVFRVNSNPPHLHLSPDLEILQGI
jgi:hypothetical protein